MGNAPEEEQDTRCRQQGTHDVNHLSHLSGIAGKLREKICRKHEERSPRGALFFCRWRRVGGWVRQRQKKLPYRCRVNFREKKFKSEQRLYLNQRKLKQNYYKYRLYFIICAILYPYTPHEH